MLDRMKRATRGVRVGVFRAARRLASAIEPRDASHLTSRLDHGDIVWRAFRDAGAALRRSGRFAEADRMVERGLAAFPGDRTFLVDYALNAHNSGRYGLAVERWEAALRRFPQDPMCSSGLAANLREVNALDRAAAVVRTALAAHPDDLVVVTEAARVADRRGENAEALALWRRAVATASPHPEWLQGEIQALVRLDRHAEAEATLAAARAAHPDDLGLLAAAGVLFSAKRDWTAALATWRDYDARVPGDPIAAHYLAEARAEGGEAGEGAERAATAPSAASSMVPAEARDLLLGFESIGDGCDFGLVQRRFGAERQGLLRWSSTSLQGLIPALQQRFEGLGRPDTTELLLDPGGYTVIRDKRWALGLHAPLTLEGAAATPGAIEATLDALRTRFLADLETAERTIVFCSPGVEAEALAALHRALEAHGPVRLLNVQPAAPTAPTSFAGQAGDVIAVAERRSVGFVERVGMGMADASDLALPDWALADWLAVCRKAAALDAG